MEWITAGYGLAPGLLHVHFSMVTEPSWDRSQMHTRLVRLPTASAYRGTAWWRIHVAKPFTVFNRCRSFSSLTFVQDPFRIVADRTLGAQVLLVVRFGPGAAVQRRCDVTAIGANRPIRLRNKGVL